MAQKYDYYEAVKEDIKEALEEDGLTIEAIKQDLEDLLPEELVEDLTEKYNEMFWDDDSITGNGSGSYTFSTFKAEENLCHNLDLLQEACDGFGITDYKELYKILSDAEKADCTIRCYLLYSCLYEIILDMVKEASK